MKKAKSFFIIIRNTKNNFFLKSYACPAGSYCSGGATTACSAGTYSNAGQSSCTICPLGSYCVAGSTVGVVCVSGTYTTGTGSTSISSCVSCVAGNSCASGLSTPCGAGYYSSSGFSVWYFKIYIYSRD